jgi:DNA-binding CsgD family transcriptional regulator
LSPVAEKREEDLSFSTEELLDLMRHLTDVAALRTNPVLQRQTLIDGLVEIYDASVGWFCVADHWLPGRQVRLIHQVLATSTPPAFLKYMGEFTVTHAVSDDPYGDHLLNSTEIEQFWTRQSVLPDAAAIARYAECVELMGKLEIGDGVVTAYRSGKDNATLIGISLHRSSGDKKISEAKLQLAKVAIREIRRMIERGHLILRGHSEPTLSPRLNQILDRLLSGATPKRIALALDLSLWTVREHIQTLYTHFGVSGREELMARFVGNVEQPSLLQASAL